ncbi:MAG: hypothetical protein K8T20_20070 [Planctomycetes bacterium]|nr:hypothetical protein [Planctomycetota bacterium]
MKELRSALAGTLTRDDHSAVRTLAQMEAASRTQPAYGVAGAALGLDDPAAALPLLRGMLADENWIVAVEAAATLALLGDRSGLGVLKGPARGGTNSMIECFHVHAALLVLGEPIPPPDRRPRSVFAALERLLDDAKPPS